MSVYACLFLIGFFVKETGFNHKNKSVDLLLPSWTLNLWISPLFCSTRMVSFFFHGCNPYHLVLQRIDVVIDFHWPGPFLFHFFLLLHTLMEDEPEKYQAHFSEYIKQGIEPDDVEEMYKKVHAAIRADPTVIKSAKELPKEHKRYGSPILSNAIGFHVLTFDRFQELIVYWNSSFKDQRVVQILALHCLLTLQLTMGCVAGLTWRSWLMRRGRLGWLND